MASGPSVPPGLRERRKEETRRRIADAAFRLFVERGFDSVTVAEIAREADVSQKTVFNYFPTKDDLVFGRMEAYESAMVDAIASRAPGEPVLSAFRRFIEEPRGLLAQPDKQEQFKAALRMIEQTPALQLREREMFALETERLAELIARETAASTDSIEPWVVANAITGVHRSLVAFVRRRVLAGAYSRTLLRELKKQVDAALDRLERGLADYGMKAE